MKKQYLILLLSVVVMAACNPSKKKETSTNEKFVISGEITGKSEGMVYFSFYNELKKGEWLRDSARIENGKFSYEADYFMPRRTNVRFDKTNYRKSIEFYIGKEKVNMKVDVNNLKATVIEGSQFDKDLKTFNKQMAEYSFVPGLEEAVKKFRDQNRPEAERHEIRNKFVDPGEVIKKKKEEEFKIKYIQEHPASELSVFLVPGLLDRKNAAYAEGILNNFEPDFRKTQPALKVIEGRIASKKETDVDVKTYLADVPDIAYQLDKSFKGKHLGNLAYLASMKNDRICGVTSDGKVVIFDTKGKILGEFATTYKQDVTSIAADENDNIYVNFFVKIKKKVKVRGRMMERHTYGESLCIVYDIKGNKLREFPLKGFTRPSGAKIRGKQLLVSNCYDNPKICIFDRETGKLLKEIEGLRACCGILDFDINEKGEFIVGNLGAFRVTGYSPEGKHKFDFGQRGQSIDEFVGCCNPVSVASLSTGAIVTVEKTPTRIKVYSKSGARLVDGVYELVKGCLHIPIAVDSKDNIYLASPEKGVVKCVAAQGAKELASAN
ncbi:DUF4369 domain-containing protein [Marinifilum sp.]|uniref:DUF4369 domain-containing protein n=1 Tax=Marinifilum sp. TaxID=2033137 RepID=UPI003BAA1FA9